MKQAASAAADHSLVIQVAGRKGRGAKAGGAHRAGKVNKNVDIKRKSGGAHGKVKVNKNVNVNVDRKGHGNRGLYRGRHVYTGGTWARPGAYWWPRGGAVAAGAALGFVSAVAAASWAGASPGPEYCWYYTDPSHKQGFWDYCP
ncbi:MAG: hypothetical protein P8Y71_23645 [Pseudolabrys sp.]